MKYADISRQRVLVEVDARSPRARRFAIVCSADGCDVPFASGLDGGAHERGAEPRRLEVDERRHRRRAMRVHLERQRRSGGAQRRHERAHALGREQPAGILEVEHVDVGARGDLARARGVVLVGVHRADAVDEADEHLVGALLLGDARDAQVGLDVVHRLRDPDPADAVADDAAQREPHDVDRRALPGHEAHARA